MTTLRERATATPRADHILAVAQRLAQTRGFNGFSYADIAAEVGITRASLHYHFPTKADLGRELVRRYSERFADSLTDTHAATEDGPERIRRYLDLYRSALRASRMCLCGMLAAEYITLPEPVQGEVRRFFDFDEHWLSMVLEEGREAGTLHFAGSPRDQARLISSAMQGGMLVAHACSDPARFEAVAARVLDDLVYP